MTTLISWLSLVIMSMAWLVVLRGFVRWFWSQRNGPC